MSNHASPPDGSRPAPDPKITPEQRAALERITAAGGRAGAWLCGLGRPGGPAWALAGAIEHTLAELRPYGPAEVDPRPGLARPGVDRDLPAYLDPYGSPAGPVIGALPLTAAQTVAVLTAAGCARIAPLTMSRPDWVGQLHALADAIDDALRHATHVEPDAGSGPDPTT
ncbi:hypothetical protein [Embleya hyalina]|uniref:Uncharacterized protein n=1 Tax=Embleya hyalina TaxID=516124 RepID=A0A401YD80_9ACTN|nr:hypothetical protein [Embleya hyalina]GCD92555.1 hypothetical protein EHYA_00193 [Embleya hyalina]